MSVDTQSPAPSGRQSPGGGHRLTWAVADAVAVTGRNLRRVSRSPELLVFTLIQPVMFVLLFRYVFGGAISPPGHLSYVNYLIPGIACQTAIFGATNTAIGLAEDLAKGFVDRLRSLPMARSAVLVGRISADLVRNVVVVLVLIAMGVAVGFRPHDALGLVLGVLVLLGFSLAFSCLMAVVGLYAPSVETAQAATFPLIFPLTFASSAFVPTVSMPGWLQAFAVHQPVTVTVNAVRSLFLGPIPATARDLLFNGDSTLNLVLQTLAWGLGISGVGLAVAVRRYRRAE